MKVYKNRFIEDGWKKNKKNFGKQKQITEMFSYRLPTHPKRF